MALPLTLSNLSATLRAVFNIDKFGIDASALTTTKTITITDTSITSPVDIIVPDEVYDATAWDGSFEVPTKNALRDKIQSISLTPGPTGDTGATGATGPTGPVGGAISIPFLFTTDTTNTDPGSGFIGFNQATQNIATIIHTDFLDSNGVSWDSVVMSFGDSTNTVKGHIRIFKTNDITSFLLFTVSATVGHTGFNNIHVTCIGSSTTNPFSAADNLTLCFDRAGDVGETGATGSSAAITPGTTDNALVRADGTGNNAIQGSPVIVDDSGSISLYRAKRITLSGTSEAINETTVPSGSVVFFTSATAVTATVANSVAADWCFCWYQKGAGQITFAVTGGALRNGRAHTKSYGQYSAGTITCESNAGTAPEVYLAGDTT